MVRSDDLLRCLYYGRSTLDLLVRSLQLQCHEVQRTLDHLAAAGLVFPTGSAGTASLTFRLTEAGAAAAADAAGRPGAQRHRTSAAVWAADDLYVLRTLQETDQLPNEVDAALHWDLGATVQHLWERGAVAIDGLVLPRVSLTTAGENALDNEENPS